MHLNASSRRPLKNITSLALNKSAYVRFRYMYPICIKWTCKPSKKSTVEVYRKQQKVCFTLFLNHGKDQKPCLSIMLVTRSRLVYSRSAVNCFKYNLMVFSMFSILTFLTLPSVFRLPTKRQKWKAPRYFDKLHSVGKFRLHFFRF